MAASSGKKGERVMFVNNERVLYFGLLGKPSVREFGAITLYFSLGSPFLLRAGSRGFEERYCAALQPYVPHEIASRDKLIGEILIEAESVEVDRVGFLQPNEDGHRLLVETHQRVRSLYSSIAQGDCSIESAGFDFDTAVFGGRLDRRVIDSRILQVVNQIKSQPSEQFPADECARSINLSLSRFLHLFRDEVGTTFRRFRGWKRARSLLNYVTLQPSLTDVALEAGYHDASHFSHSIRQVYGLKPKEIFAGSRRLEVHSHGQSHLPSGPAHPEYMAKKVVSVA